MAQVMILQQEATKVYQSVLEHLSSEISVLWGGWGISHQTVSVYGSRRCGLSLPTSGVLLMTTCTQLLTAGC